MQNQETNTTLIENVLKQDTQDIEFETIPEESDSPLSQPVVQKSNTVGDVAAAKREPEKNTLGETGEPGIKDEVADPMQQAKQEFNDAPEQEIDADPGEQEKGKGGSDGGEEYSMPLDHAKLMADSIIGTINNTVLEVGGGYFVTVRKHKDFYDFEEIIQVIDEQNVRNINRLKLDEDDKALLRPLLIHILRKKAAVMSPEKQLLMVAFSILIKKGKAVMEMRAENDALVERIREIIRKEVRAVKTEPDEETAEQHSNEKEPSVNNSNTRTRSDLNDTDYEEVVTMQHGQSGTGLPDEVLEKY